MARRWSLHEAKNKLSEVVAEAAVDGPQVITRRGVDAAVVLAYDDYRQLTAGKKKLSDFFRESPLVGVPLDLRRNRDTLREEPSL